MMMHIEEIQSEPAVDDGFFSQLVEHSPDAIVVLADGHFIFANRAAVELLGASSAEELSGSPVADFLTIAGGTADGNAASQGTSPVWRETRITRSRGDALTVELASTQISHHGQMATQVVIRDISKRKRAEMSLRESQRSLAEAHRLTRMGTWELELADVEHLEKNLTRWSDEVFRIFGHEPGEMEMSFEGFLNMVPEEDRERILSALRYTIESGAPCSIDHRIVMPGGILRTVHEEARLLSDDRQNTMKIVGVIQDITERKHVEESLRESQAKWRALAENAPDTIMTVDRDGTVLFINRTQRGGRRNQIVGLSILDQVAPEFRTKTHELLERVFDSGEPASYEYRGTNGEGETAWFSSRMGPIWSDHGVVAVALISSDITDRKAAEADLVAWKNRYEAVIQASGQIIYDWDPLRDVVTFGGSLEKTLGYRPEEMPTSISGWAELIHPEDRDDFLRRTEEIHKPGESFHLEYRIKKRDGEYLIVKDDCYSALDANGRIVQMLGFIGDMSRQRALESQLRHSQKMEAFGRLAGGVAHDFNNLLTVISGYNDIVLTDLSANDPRRECVEEIGKAADRAAALTGQLLAFSRQQVLQPRILDLNAVLADTTKMLRRLIGEDIHFVMEPAEKIGYIKADLGQLENVLVNMAVNARDAMPEGGTLKVKTSCATVDPNHPEIGRGLAPGDYVVLSVSDTGVGMSDSVKERIFEPFFTTKAIGHGTGLGLATCYGIVKQSGGYICVDSKLGCGSTFHVYLPRVPDLPEETAARRDLAGMTGGHEIIMVVEDESAVRRLAVSILKNLGYTVLEAGNGEEAFMLMQTREGQNIDLVVTDVVMPEMGGKDLAYWLRASHPDVKILFTSGYPDHAFDDHSQFGGATAFMPKPYAPKQFAEKVRGLLDGSAA